MGGNNSSHQSVKNEVKSSMPVQDQVWFFNTQHGLVIETPKRLEEQSISQPKGTGNAVSSITNYTYIEDDVAIAHMVMVLVGNQYDSEKGLRGAMTNMVNHLGGQELKLECQEINGSVNQLMCTGSFKSQGVSMQIRGYCYFNSINQVNLVTSIGSVSNHSNQILDRVFNSIELL
jgi:hypothetical protein